MQILKIKAIRRIPKTDRYDLTINSTHNFFANGILIHNTSGISANILCKQTGISWWNRFGNWLTRHIIDPIFGVTTVRLEENPLYDVIYSSRKVVKNDSTGVGYYGNDDFRKAANEVLAPHLAKGMSVYYELVGFMTNGKPIQSIGGKPMDYGCIPPGEGEKYTYGKHYDILIYRITLTDPDGVLHEFSAHEVQLWCKQQGLHAVKELYWGFAKDLYPDLDIHDPEWSTKFCMRIKEDKEHFYMELDSPDCRNAVPHEGVVIKNDDGKSAAYKVKCFKFLNREDEDYDKGVVNIEDAELEA